MASLIEEINAFQGRFSDKAAALVAKLETEGGRILPTKKNLSRIPQIIAEMKESFGDARFTEAIAQYLKELDVTSFEVLDQLKTLGKVDKGLASSITNQFKALAQDSLTNPEAFTSSLFNPLAEDMLFGVTSGASLSDTITNISATSKGLAKLVKDTANGTDMVLKRSITTFVANEVKAEFFFFQGKPIATTREWCREREGKYWHRKEIEEWGREAAAGNGWDGMAEGTNEQTIFIHLGGWYSKRPACRHVALPVHITDVPKADLDRMRAKGLIE
jgi:hypothetical protein